MPKSVSQLFKEKVNPKEIGNPQLRQALMRMYNSNYRAQLEQVNANYQAGLQQGLTPGQAATTWVLPSGPNSKYTVKDGQTLPDIAKTTGTTPADILNNNPQMKSPQTGMVIKIPPSDFKASAGMQNVSGMNGTQYTNGPVQKPKTNTGVNQYGNAPVGPPAPPNAFGQNNTSNAFNQGVNNAFTQPQPAGGFGLPSNAAQGATTTNPQGSNPLANAYNSFLNWTGVKNYNPNAYPTPAEQMVNPNAGLPPGGSKPQGASNGLPGGPISPMPNIPPSNLSPIFAQKLQTGDLTPDELKYAVQKGWVAPANKPQGQTFNSGIAFPKGNKNYDIWTHPKSRNTGRGGGGRGGGALPPRYTGSKENNLPAYASGSGFNGLVNWRI